VGKWLTWRLDGLHHVKIPLCGPPEPISTFCRRKCFLFLPGFKPRTVRAIEITLLCYRWKGRRFESTQQRLTPMLRVAWLSSPWSVSTLHKPTTPTSTVTTQLLLLWRHGTRSNKTHRDSTGHKYSHALLEVSTSFSSNFMFWSLMWIHVYSS
jgi:hypothetical protein